jgi:hypothetical protein
VRARVCVLVYEEVECFQGKPPPSSIVGAFAVHKLLSKLCQHVGPGGEAPANRQCVECVGAAVSLFLRFAVQAHLVRVGPRAPGGPSGLLVIRALCVAAPPCWPEAGQSNSPMFGGCHTPCLLVVPQPWAVGGSTSPGPMAWRAPAQPLSAWRHPAMLLSSFTAAGRWCVRHLIE